MIQLSLVVTTLILASLFITIGSWIFYGKVFKIKNISITTALKATLIIILFYIACIPAIVLLKKSGLYSPPINIIFSIAQIVCSLIIVKFVLKTNILHTIGIQIFSISLSVVFALFIKSYVIKAYIAPSGSMAPTIIPGDYILNNKFIYRFISPQRGDVIVCKSPKNSNPFIERIVAIGGDKIEIRNKILFINNEQIEEIYTTHSDPRVFEKTSNPRDNFGPITIPTNEFFLLGDNRDNSYDSRFWGSIPLNDIYGKVFTIYWSKNPTTQQTRVSRIGTTL